MRIIGKFVLRELERKLPQERVGIYQTEFFRYRKVRIQERITKDKIYNLHEPQTACIAKGKAHKAYGLGTKLAVTRGRKTRKITSIKRFAGTPHDSKTLEESLSQSERAKKHIGGTGPTIASINRGSRRKTEVGCTQIYISKTTKEKTKYKKEVA